jgi:hypothetical protein
MYKFTALLITVLFLGLTTIQAQNYSHQTLPNVYLTGDEIGEVSNDVTPSPTYQIPQSGTVSSGGFTWTYTTITDIKSGYDLQSNASAHEIWLDLNNPDYIHAVFMNSQQGTGWSDRTSLYMGSTDGGASWLSIGAVPVNNGSTGRSGYCAIYGLSTGEAVIVNHNNALSAAVTNATVFVDASPFEYNFTLYNPGIIPWESTNQPIWPRAAVNSNDDIIIAASENTGGSPVGDSFYVNYLDRGLGSFSGYVGWDGNQAETYTFAVSDAGKIGMTYLGQSVGTNYSNDGDVFYTYSDDGGQTWAAPEKIFTRDHSVDTTWGANRGLTINFFGEQPCISFETAWQDFVAGTYRQGDANSLYFWSPNINGGTAKVLYDTSWVNWNPGGGANDVMEGVCRPVLSRSQNLDYLFLAFNAATDTVNSEGSPYFAGYFMWSSDGGDTWSDAEKFTPDTPLLDFRHPSIVDISPVSPADDDLIKVHITIVGDPEAGSTVNGIYKNVTSQYYYFSTDILIVGVDDEIVANNFTLEQNYPNPFNPSTTINYTIAERSAVTLKVYDVIGNEVATLVNGTQEAGKYNVKFDASKLSSGLYIYTINTGNFTSSRKMMLLK